MDGYRSRPLVLRVFNVADEVADDFDLVDIVIGDLHADELIFDRDHQFKAIEPVGPEIFGEVRLIRDALDIDAQMLGNDSAYRISCCEFAPDGETLMTQDDVKYLKKARDQLVAQRRSLAKALAGGYKRGETENHIERIVNVQGAIDVITAAINEEHLAAPAPRAAPEQPEDRWR